MYFVIVSKEYFKLEQFSVIIDNGIVETNVGEHMRTSILLGSLLAVSCMDSEKTEEETDTAVEEETDTGESSTGDSGTADTGTEETSSPFEIVSMTGTLTVQMDFHDPSSDSDGNNLDEIYDCTATYALGQPNIDNSAWEGAVEALTNAYGEDCDCSIVLAAVEGVLSSDCLLFGYPDLEGTSAYHNILAVDQQNGTLYNTTSLWNDNWYEFKEERFCPDKYESSLTESSFSFECNGEFTDYIEEEEIGEWFELTTNYSIDLSW